MFFGKKNKTNSKLNILRIGVAINLSELSKWMSSGGVSVPVIPYKKWYNQEKFEYLLFALPVAVGRDWYFHKSSGEYSHSINATVELDDYFDARIDIQGLCGGMSPDLEIALWNGQMMVTFCRKLILMAPIFEAANIINTGQTSGGDVMNSREREIEVPISFNDDFEPVEFMKVFESTDGSGVGYSNQLVHFWMDSPKGPVVVRSTK